MEEENKAKILKLWLTVKWVSFCAKCVHNAETGGNFKIPYWGAIFFKSCKLFCSRNYQKRDTDSGVVSFANSINGQET